MAQIKTLVDKNGEQVLPRTRVEAITMSDGTTHLTDHLVTLEGNDLSGALSQGLNVNLIPDQDVTYDLGSPQNRWKDLYLSSSSLHLGDVKLSTSTGSLVLANATTGDPIPVDATTLDGYDSTYFAPINNPTFTGTVSGISAAMVGLGNVNNTSDANKPISSVTQTALNDKLSLSGGTLTGALNGTSASFSSNFSALGGRKITKGFGISGVDYKHKYILLAKIPTFGTSKYNLSIQGNISLYIVNEIGMTIDEDISLNIGYNNAVYFNQIDKGRFSLNLVQYNYNSINYLALYIYTDPNYAYGIFDGRVFNYNGWLDDNFLTVIELDSANHTVANYNRKPVTMPYQPYEYIRFSYTSIAGQWQKITGSYIVSSVGGNYNTSTNQFIVPVSGRYIITTGGYSSTGGTSSERYAFGIYQNGTLLQFSGGNLSSADTPLAGATFIFNFVKNDYIELYMFTAIAMTFPSSQSNHSLFMQISLMS